VHRGEGLREGSNQAKVDSFQGSVLEKQIMCSAKRDTISGGRGEVEGVDDARSGRSYGDGESSVSFQREHAWRVGTLLMWWPIFLSMIS
jgi:hypothetical protein